MADGTSLSPEPEQKKSDGGLTLDETCQMFLDCARYADEDDVKILKELLAERPSIVHTRDEEGRTAVHLAAANGNVEICKLLVAAQAKPNEQNNEGNTALHYASEQNQPAVVEFLLSAGWKPSIKNRYGDTAANIIAEKNFPEVELLLTKFDDQLDSYKAPGATVIIGDEVAEADDDNGDSEAGVKGALNDAMDPAPAGAPHPPQNASAPSPSHPTNVGGATMDDVE
jgi:hypothetical protein